jgi:receptor expression-enhancing protein 5/6
MERDLDDYATKNPSSETSDIPNSKNIDNPQIKFSLSDKWKEIMKSIKDKTGIDGIFVIIFLSLCVLLVYMGIFESLITSLVGTLYPGFSTIKAIQKNKDKKEWLTYWVIFGSFLIFDMFSTIIIKVVPYYFVLKIIFLIWMFIPGSNGCQIVYDFLISKVMKPIEQIIDIFFEEYKEMRGELVKNAKSRGQKIVKNIKKIAEKMKNKQIEKAPTIRNKIEDNVNPASVSTLIPPVKSESLMTKVKSQETKEEDKEKEEHIKFENAINEYSKMMNQESVETQNKDDDNGDLSPLEDNIDDNKN